MERPPLRRPILFILSLLLLLMPAISHAQQGRATSGPPPIAPPLVREGDFAVSLSAALGVGTTEDEVEAETRLGEVGIVPRNGWIADYPVTPDIMSELQKSVSNAADAQKLSMSKDEALKRFDAVSVDLGVAVKPFAGNEVYRAESPNAENYPNPDVVNNYYYEEGPPVMTYYPPPPDYYYLYAWVPSPFWCYGFWFPGFFVLHDFHRVVHVHNRAMFVSNHFNDVKGHRVFRVDPVTRFSGRTFAGIGAPRTGGFVSTGIPRSERRIFNAPPRTAPSNRVASPPPAGGSRMVSPPSRAPMAGQATRSGGPGMAGQATGGGGPGMAGQATRSTGPGMAGQATGGGGVVGSPSPGGNAGTGGSQGGGFSGGSRGGAGVSGGGHGGGGRGK